MPRPPDFVVLPDVVTNPEATKKRSSQWAGVIDERTAFPVQDGIEPEDAVETADRLGAEVIFVGGTVTWKRGIAAEMVTASHEHGLDCHIGRPGDLNWAQSIGADSVDTTSILASEAWDRLRRFEAAAPQATVTDF